MLPLFWMLSVSIVSPVAYSWGCTFLSLISASYNSSKLSLFAMKFHLITVFLNNALAKSALLDLSMNDKWYVFIFLQNHSICFFKYKYLLSFRVGIWNFAKGNVFYWKHLFYCHYENSPSAIWDLFEISQFKISVESGLCSPVKVSRDEVTSCTSSLSTPQGTAALSVLMLHSLMLVILHCIFKSGTWEKYKVRASEELYETKSRMSVKHVRAAVIGVVVLLLRIWIIPPLHHSFICGEKSSLGNILNNEVKIK